MPPRYDPKYEKENDWTVYRFMQSTGDVLRFAARDIRKERTGVHARVAVTYNQVSLATDLFNVERDRDRTHLINAAMKRAKQRGYQFDMTEFDIDHGFDLFCEGLWEQQLNTDVGELMEGALGSKLVQLIQGLLVEGGGTMIYAPPGRGKTYTLLTMAVCLDAGLSLPGVFEVLRPERVLFINLERSGDSMASRLGHVNRALGLPFNRPLLFMNRRGQSLRNIYQAAQETLTKYGAKAVALDSLSRAGSGSLIDDEDANAAMDMLNGLAPTWFLSAHTSRQDTSHAFGSQMFDAAIDVGVQLSSQQRNNTTGVGLQVTKENDLGPQPMRIMALEFGDNGDGLQLIRQARQHEFPEVEGAKRMSLAEEITGLLLQVGPMSCPALARELGRERTTVSHLLNRNDGFTVVGRQGKEVLWALRQQVKQVGHGS